MNAISNIPLIAKIILPLLAIFTIWLLSGEEDKVDKTQPKISFSSDYAVTNFVMSVMDENGKLSRVVSGQEMAHYPHDDSTEIIFPVATLIEHEKDTWIISSNEGHTQGKGDDILLTGNVIITREINNEIELRTEKLNIDTVNSTAYTDLAVTLKAPQGTTDGVGMHASFNDKTINLHSKVKGHYNAPSTQ